jgi:hypothetical protein
MDVVGVPANRCGWIEQLVAQVLQEPGSGGGEREAALAVRDPAEHRPDEGMQLASPGSRPMTLVRRRVSPKVRSMNRPS